MSYLAAWRGFSKNAKLFLLITLLTSLSTGGFNVLFGITVLRLGQTESFLGSVLAVGIFTSGALALPSGLLADWRGNKVVLLAALGLTGLGLLGQALWPLGSPAFGFSFLFGAGQAMLGVVSMPFLAENSSAADRAVLFSLNFTLTMLGQVLGSLSAGKLPDLLPLQASLAILSLLQGIALVLVAGVREQTARKNVEPIVLRKNFAALRHSTLARDVSIYNGLIGLGAGLVIPFFNIFLTERLQSPTAFVGVVMSMSQVAMAVAGLFAPLMMKRFGKAQSVVLSQLLSIPFLLMIALPQSLWLVVVSFLLRNALMNMNNPLSASLIMEITPVRQRATISSFMSMSQNLLRGLSAAVGGWLMQKAGYSLPYFFTAGLYLLASVHYWRAFLPREREFARRAGRSLPI